MTVQLKEFSFTYLGSKIPAVSDITLRVTPGEMIFLVGGNSSGKTTLLTCLAGLVPDLVQGTMHGGIEAVSPVGMVLQASDVYLFSEVWEELTFSLIRGNAKRETEMTRAQAAAKEVGVYSLWKRKMASLSGGERQRVAIAAAMLSSSSLILCDEPLEQLDALSAVFILKLLKKRAREGAMVIISSRNFDYCEEFADRILVMQQGRIIGEGTPHDIQKLALLVPECLPPLINENRELKYDVDNHVLQFDNVSFHYPQGGGVKNINLSVYEGETLAIMGPNGAGKTTLVKHAVGILKPQQGQVMFKGKDTRTLSRAQLAREIGILFQNPDDQIFNERVDKEIAWSLKARGLNWPQALDETTRWLKRWGLEYIAAQHPHTLPYSMRQMVALLSVLITKPEVIILDEPAKSLDYKNVALLMRTLRDLNEEKQHTILMVTHDPVLAGCYADRVALISQGQLAAVGPSMTILRNKAAMAEVGLDSHPFVQKLLQQP